MIGLKEKKYLVESNGAKNATPRPPFVIASRRPCEAVTKKKNRTRVQKSFEKCFTPLNARGTTVTLNNSAKNRE